MTYYNRLVGAFKAVVSGKQGEKRFASLWLTLKPHVVELAKNGVCPYCGKRVKNVVAHILRYNRNGCFRAFSSDIEEIISIWRQFKSCVYETCPRNKRRYIYLKINGRSYGSFSSIDEAFNFFLKHHSCGDHK